MYAIKSTIASELRIIAPFAATTGHNRQNTPIGESLRINSIHFIQIELHFSKASITPLLDKPVNAVTKEERKRLAHLLKNMNTTITGVRGFNEAIITQGGVNTREINPSTLESRQCSGLYIVGEMLDIDAVTGGYNLQIAWSTGYLAGISI